MAISVFDLFKIGIGPSSSHTVGPMRAARSFALALHEAGLLDRTAAVRSELFGSLGATGRGHGSDKAVILGLLGETPDEVDVERVDDMVTEVRRGGALRLLGRRVVAFREPAHLALVRRSLPHHPNGMRFTALDETGASVLSRVYYSVGGGFVVDAPEPVDEAGSTSSRSPTALQGARDAEDSSLPHPFHTGAQLLARCQASELSISQLMLANERVTRSDAEIRAGLDRIWQVMQTCVQRGCRTEGILPGGLKVHRRAPALYRKLMDHPEAGLRDPLTALDWVSLYALSVSEENAGGGRVVTAPTNGAAGIIPAVLHYYRRFVPTATDEGVQRFLLTAAAIGVLYKENASISGAEVGCQGEVGSACSMAAGALCEVMGGSPAQAENAAEIAMEHNLGLTCDPIGGLVQVPCIERNAMAAIKAINAARMALHGNGQHFVSLDKVIRTMRITGEDMKDKYKETARGGLAVRFVEAPADVSVGLPEC
ncbi:L-serine ammonia-lyase [Chondromyces crocatus]|uniref:L-serine dehydratase n=1 Tax=Chondromyces crocatus TaxID=52 RepID=A0A0K1EDP0_CHOCO|nr:L-serine ammonia-lyase [Chondromyces crocatus]AKT38802.1 serine dehydratase [Chondromyces crocatus]